MDLLRSARSGFKAFQSMPSVSRGYGGTMSGILGFGNAPSGRNWNIEAGLRYDKSVVFAAVMFACGALGEVDIFVKRPDGSGNYKEVKGHQITLLLQNPNPFYDFSTLLSGWIISEICGAQGMSYTYKHRSAAGKVFGLEYVPHFAIRPYSSPGTTAFIDNFLMSIRGGMVPVDPGNILQQSYGPIDPLWPQVHYGPLNAALLEVCTDKEALNYTASLLYNVGVTPHLISPSAQGFRKASDAGYDVVYDETDLKMLEDAFMSKITGGNRGMPLMSPLPIEVNDISLSPDAMNLEGVHSLSEERVCAVLRIPPVVLNLGTGLQQQNNRASSEAAAKAAARDFTKPYMIRKGSQLTRDLVPELGEPGDIVCFRIEGIEALQEDKTQTAKRDQIECQTYKTVNEKREEKGLKPIDGGDICLWQNVKVQTDKEQPDDDPEADEPDDDGNAPKPAPKKKR